MTAVWALLLYIGLIIFWAIGLKRNIGEAMILGFFVTALFGGGDFLSLIRDGFIFGATHEVLFAAMSFVFMAYLVDWTGTIYRLINILNSMLGRLPGGAGYVDTIASALFGTISGSGSGNTAAVGSITIPWMLKSNWSKKLSATVVAGNAGMGISFPPNGSMFILLGSASIASVITEGQLFISLFVAGFYTLLYRLLLVWWFVKKNKIQKVDASEIQPFSVSIKNGWTSLLIFLGILIPVILTIGPVSEFLAAANRLGPDALDTISILIWVPVLIITIAALIGWKTLPLSIREWKAFTNKIAPQFSVIGAILLFAFAASEVLNNIGLGEQLGAIMESLAMPSWLIIAIVGLLILTVATPLTATATVTAIGLVSFNALTAAGVDPVVAAVAILVFASTEGASPPGAAPIFIASGIAGVDPVKTFVPLIFAYVLPIGIIGWLIAMGILPIPL